MHIEKQIQDPLGSPLHAYALSRHLHCRLTAPVRRTDIYFRCVLLTVARTHTHIHYMNREHLLYARDAVPV